MSEEPQQHNILKQHTFLNSNIFWIDVRDVARAHLGVFDKEETKGQSLVVSAKLIKKSILDVLNAISAWKGNIVVDWDLRAATNAAAAASQSDNSKTRSLLGFEFIDLKTSVIDSANQILQYEAAQE